MQFSVVNLGCKVNRVESDSFSLHLLNAQAQPSSIEEADVVLVNTCAVTAEAEKKTRKEIRRILRANSHARVVVTGCSSNLQPNFYAQLSEAIMVCDKRDVEQVLDDLVAEQMQCCNVEDNLPASDMAHHRAEAQFSTRVGLKIQDGCDHDCSYCIVHVARGKAWSVPFETIVTQAREFEELQVKEIVLTGIDLGSYCDEGRDLAALLQALVSETSNVRYRISSIEPKSVTRQLLDVIARHPQQICPHFHLPLQSGSNKVLAEMRRPYTADEFLALTETIYERFPTFSISTDIIVGFPGESEDDFRQTLEVAKKARFSKIHSFRYSPREGTPAAVRPDQITPEVKEQRARELRNVAAELRNRFACSLVGRTEDIVVEKQGWGTTASYYKVKVSDSHEVGARFSACLTEYDESGMFKL